MSSRYASLDAFDGCIEQLTFNGECLPLYDDSGSIGDREQRLATCNVLPVAESSLQRPSSNSNDEPLVWRFSGRANSGELEFVPSLTAARHAELRFAFNASRGNDGTIMCTRDDSTSLKAELIGQQLLFSISDVRTRRVLKTLSCRLAAQRADWHKIHLVKKSRNQVLVTCNDLTSTLNYDVGGVDIPFVNTRHGLKIGVDCVNEKGRKFAGEIGHVS